MLSFDSLDGKLYVSDTMRKAKDDTIVPPTEWLAFRPYDNALPAALHAYYQECGRLGCDAAHLNSVHQMINRVEEWRRENPSRCKNPDTRTRVAARTPTREPESLQEPRHANRREAVALKDLSFFFILMDAGLNREQVWIQRRH